MSVICYRDGVLASDSRAYGGSGCPSPGLKAKVHLLEDGRRVGIVSAKLGHPEKFLAWLKDGGDVTAWTGDMPDLRAIVVHTDGTVSLYDDNIWPSGPIEPAEFFALGSGTEYALGAMYMGATAEQAVEAAIRFGQQFRRLRPGPEGLTAAQLPESLQSRGHNRAVRAEPSASNGQSPGELPR